jgi:hypothetical protein
MTIPGRQLHVRLPDDLAKAYDQLCSELPGLQPGVILRCLLADQMSKPLEQRIHIVTEQLKRKPSATRPPAASERPGLNAKNRIS